MRKVWYCQILIQTYLKFHCAHPIVDPWSRPWVELPGKKGSTIQDPVRCLGMRLYWEWISFVEFGFKFRNYAKGTFINDVPRFSAISDLPTYLVLLYNVPFLGLSWTLLPNLIRDVINERSLSHFFYASPIFWILILELAWNGIIRLGQ